MASTDKASEVRKGEGIEPEKLAAYLKGAVTGLTGELRLLQYPKGHSNLTYLVTVGERELILRRPPMGTKAKSAHDMGREFRVLSALHPVYPYAPRPVHYCEDPEVIGDPFYLMEPIRGIILRRDLPAGVSFRPDEISTLFDRLIGVQCELHAVDWRAAGLEDFGRPAGYVKRQVDGWSRRYRNARTPDAPSGEEAMDWLAARMPPDTDRPAVIHNDFKTDNVVLDPDDPTRIVGVLDWEMATVGDPLMDLGCSLGYWVEPGDPEEMQAIRMLPTHLKGCPTRREVVDAYSRLSGRAVDHYSFYYCFGLFRLAVIAQQIYFRYYHGQTGDKRFGLFIFAVNALIRSAERIAQEV